MDERRVFERFDTAIEAILVYGDLRMPCVVCDVSEGGIGIVVKKADTSEKPDLSYGVKLHYIFTNDELDLEHECFFVYMKETEDEYRIGAVSREEDLEALQ